MNRGTPITLIMALFNSSIQTNISNRTIILIPLSEIIKVLLPTEAGTTTMSYQSHNFQMNGGKSLKANSKTISFLIIIVVSMELISKMMVVKRTND